MTVTMMRASAREMRHMVGRYLHAGNCPAAVVNPVRDAILAAQAEGYDAAALMERLREEFPDAAAGLRVSGSAGVAELDGRGRSALLLAPALLDELGLAVASGAQEVRVRRLRHLDVLNALHDYAAVRGVGFSVLEADEVADTARLRVGAVPRIPAEPASGAAGSAMERILREGYELDAEQFWRLFHESNEALTPDSELSRRHAGSQLYAADGRLLGELDEETYLHLRSETDEPAREVHA